jgi:hypothetical protein
MKDTLFLLTPGFHDGDGAPYYCPHCTIFEGLIHLFPQVSSCVEVRRVAFPRPRPEIVALLDAEHQSCPVLVLGESSRDPDGSIEVQRVGKARFIDDPEAIGNYLSAVCGIPRPH